MKKLDQKGFHLIELVIVLAVLGTIGFVGMKVLNRKAAGTNPGTSSSGLHKATAGGLVDADALECVPRGHDNYRTNDTLAVDPTNANIAYVGVEYKGVFKTTDGGTTWKQSDSGIRGYPKEGNTKEKCIQEMGRTIIDPKDNKHLLISRVESPGDLGTLFSENAGVWESFDAGGSWKQIVKPGMNASGSQAIAFDPQDSKTIYMGVNNSHPSFTDGNGTAENSKYFNKEGVLYQTTDGGKTWKELPTGISPGFRAIGVSIDPADSKKIWLYTFNGAEDGQQASESDMKTILISSDGGKTWESQADKIPAGFHQLVGGSLSPKDSQNAIMVTASISGSPKNFVTLDGGKTWSATSTYTLAANYDPNDPTGHHLLGYAPYDNKPGIYESTNGGKTWSFLSSSPSEVDGQGNFGVRISDFVWSQTEKNVVYMSGSNSMVWKSTNGGKTWKTVMTLDSIGGPNKNKEGNTKSREQDPSSAPH